MLFFYLRLGLPREHFSKDFLNKIPFAFYVSRTLDICYLIRLVQCYSICVNHEGPLKGLSYIDDMITSRVSPEQFVFKHL